MLENKSCVPCKGGIPPMPAHEAEQMLKEIPRWRLDSDGKKIRRGYDFPNFLEAVDFLNKIARLAEEEGHHPDMTVGWGYCEVVFYSHKIGGLHENDFIVARKTDLLYE